MHCNASALDRGERCLNQDQSHCSLPHLGKSESYAEGRYYNLTKTYLYNADKTHGSSQLEENKSRKYLQHHWCEKNRWKVSVREQSICGGLFARQSLRLGTKVEVPKQTTSRPPFSPSRPCSKTQSTYCRLSV